MYVLYCDFCYIQINSKYTGEKCNENDINKKDTDSHLMSECKYSTYGCETSPNLKFSESNKHNFNYTTYHLELKMDSKSKLLNNKIIQQNKIIEHYKCKYI